MAQTQQTAPHTSAPHLKVKPLGNRILVRRLAAEEKVKGGILLPDTAQKKQEQAQVVAVGPGKKDKNGTLVAPPVKAGDTILMEKYSGQEVNFEGEEYVILRFEDIIALVTE